MRALAGPLLALALCLAGCSGSKCHGVCDDDCLVDDPSTCPPGYVCIVGTVSATCVQSTKDAGPRDAAP